MTTKENRENFQEDQISLRGYYKDIRKYSIVSPDEQKELVRLAQTGDKIAEEKLICCNQRFIVSIAKEYLKSGLTLGDLINEGNIGLIKAISKFDLDLYKEIKFLSYAVWWVRQAMLQTIYENSTIVRVPVNRLNMNSKITKVKDRLTQELNREPTAKEIGDVSELTEEEVLSVIDDYNTQLSLDAQIGEDSDVTLIDLIENDSFQEVESGLNYSSLRQEIESVLGCLSDREKKIIELSFGLNGVEPQNLKEIGETLKLTNERVRQIKESTIKKLRTYNKSKRLREFLNMKFS